MELYIGGYGSGKYECVESLVSEVKIWKDFHLFVREELKAGKSPELLKKEIFEIIGKNPEIVIVSDEIGNGIVPSDIFERMYREETGRLLCAIAEKAQKVVRIVCGLPQRIK